MFSYSVLTHLGITAIYATNQHGLTLPIWWEAIMLHCKNIKKKAFQVFIIHLFLNKSNLHILHNDETTRYQTPEISIRWSYQHMLYRVT